MNRLQKLKSLSRETSKKYGSSIIGIGTSGKILDINRLHTGSLMLDYVMGGGLAVGRVTKFFGAESSGKTTTALRIAGIQQETCANCYRRPRNFFVEVVEDKDGEEDLVAMAECDCFKKGLFVPQQYPDEKNKEYAERIKAYELNSFEECRVALIDAEGDFNGSWAEQLGVDRGRLVYSRPDTAEEAIDVYDVLMRTGAVDLIILDSIAFMTPAVEIEKSATKQQQGEQARLIGKFCRRVNAASNMLVREYAKLTSHIWINQVREKIGVMFGSNINQPGGRAQRHAAGVEVQFWQSEKESSKREEESLSKKEELEIGESVRINFKCTKNKTAPAHGKGSYVMPIIGPNAGYVDETKVMFKLCEKYDEISREKGKYVLSNGTEFGTQESLMDYWVGNPLELEAMKKRLLKGMLANA